MMCVSGIRLSFIEHRTNSIVISAKRSSEMKVSAYRESSIRSIVFEKKFARLSRCIY